MFALLVHHSTKYVKMDEANVKLRIGINVGELVTGITGKLTPHYCCAGNTVVVASRMESTGSADRIHISSEMASIIKSLRNSNLYNCIKREELTDVKGKGKMQTYWLEPSDELDIESVYRDHLIGTIGILSNLSNGWAIPVPIISTSYGLTNSDIAVENDIEDSQVSDTQSPMNVSPNLERTKFFRKSFNFTKLSSFEFDISDVKFNDHFEMIHLEMVIFENMVDFSSLNINKLVLHNYISKIAGKYRFVPYHNFYHSFCVVQFTTALLKCCNLRSFLPQRWKFMRCCLVLSFMM
jgi:hypothetical protein